MESVDYHSAKAMLSWQVEMGATEAVCDSPVDWYAIGRAEAEAAKTSGVVADPGAMAAGSKPVPVLAQPAVDPVAEAKVAAAAANSLDDLRAAMDGFAHCDLRRGARNLVFAGGNPAARLMVVGDAPDADEDRQGRPFVGKAGQLLDRMLAAIGLDRASDDPAKAVYITNVLPWRPPGNRDSSPDEAAMMKPFLLRHIELAAPQIVMVMGNPAAQTLLGKSGITRLRGTWDAVAGLPAMPTLHPAFLLLQPEQKARAWADLLAIRARLNQTRA